MTLDKVIHFMSGPVWMLIGGPIIAALVNLVLPEDPTLERFAYVYFGFFVANLFTFTALMLIALRRATNQDLDP
jgi:hypothetical protein